VTDRVQTTIRPEDRLFHLILALMATSHGVSKDHILHSVRGYREDADAGVARETLERRFERDKDILRDMGIPLETWIPADDDGNNRNTLYRIPKGRFDHPTDLDFSAQDIRLLNVAAAIWREGSLSGDARIATVKLASHGIDVDEPLVGALPMITARDPALASLRLALAEKKQVSFSYLKPGLTTPSQRTVSPLAVVLHEARWHLLGLDSATGEERTFLLRRIVSAVDIHDTPAHPDEAGHVASMSAELDRLFENQVATVDVVPHSQAATILAHRPGTTIQGNSYRLHYTDPWVLADELCEHGPDVVVTDPPELVHALTQQLQALARAHVD
jgi:proteasome accessory factor B